MPKKIANGRLKGFPAIAEDWFLSVHLDSSWDDDSPDAGRVNRLTLDGFTADLPAVEQMMATLLESGFCLDTVAEEEFPIDFVYPQPGDLFNGVGTATRYLRRLHFDDYRANYTPETVTQVDRLLVQILPNADHGVVIIHGPTGTVKTYMLRSMLSETNRRAVVCSPTSDFLTQSSLLYEAVQSHTRSLVILEDVGEFLLEDNVSAHMDATITLLNFSDGLQSILANTIFVLTFNSDLRRISPALTRPGRCLAQVEVENLPYLQAQELVGFAIPERSYTLAEVYQMREERTPLVYAKRASVGFLPGY